MIHGLMAVIAVLLRFAFLFGIYYLIKGVLLLSGRSLPLRGQESMSKEDREKWTAGEGKVCLYWAVILILASVSIYLLKTIAYILAVLFCVLLIIGYVKRVKNNIKYRK